MGEKANEYIDYVGTAFERFDDYFAAHGIELTKSYLINLSEKVDISDTILKAILVDHSRFRTEYFITLANYFHLSSDYLLGITDEQVNFGTYSDLFFFLKHMIDKGILNYGQCRLPGTTSNSLNIETCALTGKFKTLIAQYAQLERILFGDQEYLQSWEDITIKRLNAAHEEVKNVFNNRYRELQDLRGISNVEMKELLSFRVAETMIDAFRKKSTSKPTYPGLDALPYIAKILNTSTDYLLGLSNNRGFSVSEADIFTCLLYLYKNGYIAIWDTPDQLDYQNLNENGMPRVIKPTNDGFHDKEYCINETFMSAFCSLYLQRKTFSSEDEQMAFYEKVQQQMSYPILTREQMNDYNQYIASKDNQECNFVGVYMEGMGMLLNDFYEHIKKSEQPEEPEQLEE